MNPLDWIKVLLGKGIVEPIATYQMRRLELRAAKHAAEMAALEAEKERRVTLIREGLAADMNWEMEFARQAASTWKDEYTLIVISVPAIMCFIPGFSPYVRAGFDALEATPAWYQLVFISLFLATVGIRYWRRNQSDT